MFHIYFHNRTSGSGHISLQTLLRFDCLSAQAQKNPVLALCYQPFMLCHLSKDYACDASSPLYVRNCAGSFVHTGRVPAAEPEMESEHARCRCRGNHRGAGCLFRHFFFQSGLVAMRRLYTGRNGYDQPYDSAPAFLVAGLDRHNSRNHLRLSGNCPGLSIEI